MPSNFKVAFIGDQGDGPHPTLTLQVLKDWGAQVVFHQGDADYNGCPNCWETMVNSVLGEDFPYFMAMGNHDAQTWNDDNGGYRVRLEARNARIPGVNCTGELGTFSVCSYNGLLFTLNGMGLAFTGHEEYVEEAFSAYPDIVWKICSWHNNNRQYQVGGKLTSVDVELYDTCRRHGAIIATGHEHSYARTHLMSSFESNTVASTNNTLNLSAGETFAFCHGLGGRSIREYVGNLPNNPWWAATAAADDGVNHGPLLCTFNIDGDIRRGSCFFTDNNNRTWDSFSIYSNVGAGNSEISTTTTSTTATNEDFQKVPRCHATSVSVQMSMECVDGEGEPSSDGEFGVGAMTISPLSSISTTSLFTMSFPLDVDKYETIVSASLEFLGLYFEFIHDHDKAVVTAYRRVEKKTIINNGNDKLNSATRSRTCDHGKLKDVLKRGESDIDKELIPRYEEGEEEMMALMMESSLEYISEEIWDFSQTDFNEPIWQSSQLAPLLTKVKDSKNFNKGDEVILTIKLQPSPIILTDRVLTFATAGRSPAVAPTIAIFLASRCFY